ncbi:MAG TPA: hypothetical protein VGQ86_04100 [Candidatus Limnocylindria bacterium]|nr:hypothetical protein [Candidatus Limnocylindria bacterium]
MSARELDSAALLSLAAGYCAVAKRDGKQPAKAEAEPYAGPLITARAAFGPAGRRRSLEERPAVSLEESPGARARALRDTE